MTIPNDGPTIDVAVTIDDAIPGQEPKPGQLQTRDRKYNYSFDPDRVHVTSANTKIVYSLNDSGKDKRFEMSDIFTTDARGQITGVKRTDKNNSIEMYHANTVKQLTVVLVVVKDRKNPQTIGLDPQVTNDPTP